MIRCLSMMILFVLVIVISVSSSSSNIQDWFQTFKSRHDLEDMCKELGRNCDMYAALPFEITSTGFSRRVGKRKSFLMVHSHVDERDYDMDLRGDGAHRTMHLSPFEQSKETCVFAYLVALPRFWYVDLDELRYLDIDFDSADTFVNIEASSSRSTEHAIIVYSENAGTLELPVHLRYQDPIEDSRGYRDTPVPNVASFANCDDTSHYVRLYDTKKTKYSDMSVLVPVGIVSNSYLVGTITNIAVLFGTSCLVATVLCP